MTDLAVPLSIPDTQAFLRRLITDAGQITLDYRASRDTMKITQKAYKDFVTEADTAVERFLVEQIGQRFAGHGFYGEETGQVQGNDFRWVIDPIDGTVSFIRGLPVYSVSVALEYCGQTLLGAVYLPALGELFEAARGCRPTLNGKPIQVSGQCQLDASLWATGFACQRLDVQFSNMTYVRQVMPHIQDIRRFGSAAADLCYVACGRFDGFWELNLNLYDIAAGAFIAEQAGAVVSDFAGGKAGLPGQILCANPHLHNAMKTILELVK